MAYRSPKTALRALYRTATGQGGYFTSKQAADAGYGKRHVAYHLKAGNFERIGHGLYRLPTVPVSDHDDFIRVSLWSRGRDDVPQAVISHTSALTLHEMSDLLPGKIHLTVPQTFRKAAPRACILHRAAVPPTDAVAWPGFRVTTPLRTLIDAANSPTVPIDQLRQAITDALERGLVRRSVLVALSKRNDRFALAIKSLR